MPRGPLLPAGHAQSLLPAPVPEGCVSVGCLENFGARLHRLLPLPQRSYGCFIDLYARWSGPGGAIWPFPATVACLAKPRRNSKPLSFLKQPRHSDDVTLFANKVVDCTSGAHSRPPSIRLSRVHIANRICSVIRDLLKRPKMASIVRPARKRPVLYRYYRA